MAGAEMEVGGGSGGERAEIEGRKWNGGRGSERVEVEGQKRS